MVKEEVLSSLKVQDYLANYLEGESDKSAKMEVFSFLKKYLMEDYYAVEVIKTIGDKDKFIIRIEDIDDKFINELDMGEITYGDDESIDDYELLDNSREKVNDYVNSVVKNYDLTAEERFYSIVDLLDYINRDLYRVDATDKDEDMLQLILDHKDNVVDKIYY